MFGKISIWIGSWGVTIKVLVPAVVVVCVTAGVIVCVTWHNTREAAIAQSVSNAEKTILQYTTLRAYYTTHVVQKVADQRALRVSHDHKGRTDTIPLPATLIHDLGEELAHANSAQLRLYSAHPFPNRRDRKLDEFGLEALAYFQKNPDGGTFTRVTRINGEETVRVAVADRMVSQACVNCHNQHPDSPKKDWKVGDVRGVLEVDTSIERPLEEAAKLSQLVTAVTVTGGTLILVVISFNLRRIRRGLSRAVVVFDAARAGDLSKRVEVLNGDELGRMGATLNDMVDVLAKQREAEQKQAEKERELVEAERKRAAEQTEQDRLQAEKDRAAAERDAAQTAELRRKVDTITVTVSALAAGDFTQQIPDLGTDAVGRMAVGLNQAVVAVRTTLERVREVSEQLADASGQMAAASEEIATGAQQQASSLEETASTLEEITATVKQNSDSAQQARQLASGSKDVAEKGGAVVSSAVEAMGEINQSSKKIVEIITAIDEIAFQTNLLALNAAVEAARAGEQGRGFAVVATEVRNLAQRSATAAKEIKALIQDSVKKVDAGTELVNRSGSTLSEIVTSVKRVTDIVTEIAAASREQSTGIDQVNKAVTQMDSVTQKNASQTEEMSATAQTLTEQASQLRDLVNQFKLGHEATHSSPSKPAAPMYAIPRR